MSKLIPLITFFGTVACALAGPKIASVDFAKVMEAYHIAQKDKDELTEKRDALTKNERAIMLKKRQSSLEELFKKFQSQTLTDEQRKTAATEVQAARLAYDEIKAEWNSWYPLELQKLNKEFVTRSRATLNQIIEISQKVGESQGYDWVIDLKGHTSSQMPVVVYARDTTDITEEVIKIINKDAPPQEEGVDEEKESNAENPQ